MPFVKGQSGNPHGRAKGAVEYFSASRLALAVKELEAETGRDLIKHAIQRAFVDDRVLCFLLNKFIPDARHIESTDEKYQGEEIEFAVVSSEKIKEEFKRYMN